MSPKVEISSIPENVHFPSRNPSGTATQFAAKWTPENYFIYHSRDSEFKVAGQAERADAREGTVLIDLGEEVRNLRKCGFMGDIFLKNCQKKHFKTTF